MPLPVIAVIFALRAYGTSRKVKWLLAIIPPVMERMKSPSLRVLMTTLVPRMMETSFRYMTLEDKKAVLDKFEALVEEHRGKDREQDARVPTS